MRDILTAGEEVRYHMLRPDEIVPKREACPIAWLPVGTLEWHGPHNPVGSDTLQAEGLAILCARRGGGLVFPPLYMGDIRGKDWLIETTAEFEAAQVAAHMRLPVSNFDDDKFGFSSDLQVERYLYLLEHMLYEVQSLGFKVCVMMTGHYPLTGFVRQAALEFQKKELPMTAWGFVDYQLLEDKYAFAGDHAGYWETSHMMALYPERVDLSTLPPGNDRMYGVFPKEAHSAQESNAAFGMQILTEAADIAIARAKLLLENPRDVEKRREKQ